MPDPAPAAPASTGRRADPALLHRAARTIRHDVEHGAGAVTRSADELFDRFGFVPASYDEQRHIEEALTAAGVRVEPLDASGRQLRLLRSEVVAPTLVPVPTPAPPPDFLSD